MQILLDRPVRVKTGEAGNQATAAAAAAVAVIKYRKRIRRP